MIDTAFTPQFRFAITIYLVRNWTVDSLVKIFVLLGGFFLKEDI